MFKLAGVVITCAVMTACGSSNNSPNSPNKGKASSGDADFTTFVTIGDSLTAGYTDRALFMFGQQNSFPNTLATQFADADGVDVSFEQPLTSDDLGGLLFGGAPNPSFANRLVLNTETQAPEPIAGDPTTEVIGSGLNGMTFNNMGVPGAKSFHLLAPAFGDPAGLNPDPALATANPYYVRFSLNTVDTVMDDVAAQAPTFFTLWIGNNDVLGYATSGGDDSDPITPTATFDAAYGGILATLAGANPSVQGVLVNVPDVGTIPFFTTVPFNAVPLEDQADVDALNGAYAAYNTGLDMAAAAMVITAEEAAQRKIVFALGQNAMVILDETLTPIGAPNMRQTTANDLVVLTASTAIKTAGGGTSVPLADADVLIPSEIQAIETARTAYNATIKAAAEANPNLVFFDAAALMAELSATGIDFGNGSINADFATGGAFGLDGVHPTGRGYAVIANAIIDEINTGFNANVFKVDPALFPAIFLK